MLNPILATYISLTLKFQSFIKLTYILCLCVWVICLYIICLYILFFPGILFEAKNRHCLPLDLKIERIYDYLMITGNWTMAFEERSVLLICGSHFKDRFMYLYGKVQQKACKLQRSKWLCYVLLLRRDTMSKATYK